MRIDVICMRRVLIAVICMHEVRGTRNTASGWDKHIKRTWEERAAFMPECIHLVANPHGEAVADVPARQQRTVAGARIDADGRCAAAAWVWTL